VLPVLLAPITREQLVVEGVRWASSRRICSESTVDTRQHAPVALRCMIARGAGRRQVDDRWKAFQLRDWASLKQFVQRLVRLLAVAYRKHVNIEVSNCLLEADHQLLAGCQSTPSLPTPQAIASVYRSWRQMLLDQAVKFAQRAPSMIQMSDEQRLCVFSIAAWLA